MSNRLYISMYHYTREIAHSRYPGIKGLELELFRQQLDFFNEQFNVVRMEDVLAALDGVADLPDKALLLTFDDGYIDNYTVAFPFLRERGMQGSFFVPGKTFSEHKVLDVNKIHYILATNRTKELLKDLLTKMDDYRGVEYDYPPNEELYEEYAVANRFDSAEVIFIKRMLQTVLSEKLRNRICSDLFEKYVGVTEEQLAYELYMTRDQIREMKRGGMFFGIHGYDHHWLASLPKKEMEQDIINALDSMGEFIDRRAWVMNYPYGDFSEEVVAFVQAKGAVAGLTTEVRAADLDKDHRMMLPRLDCNDFPPKSESFLHIDYLEVD